MEEQKLRVLQIIRAPGGWALVPVSFMHDPEKASPEWEMKERAKYPDEVSWAREMIIDFGDHAGSPAYPAFQESKHVVDELKYDDTLPLLVALDFNVNPMSCVISHLENGWLRVIDEIVEPGSIDSVLQEFRNRYPAHRGDLIFYGDATRGTSAQTAKSNWMVVQVAMRGYCVKTQFRVPFANPNIGDRLNAVNRKLSASEGVPGMTIDKRCKQLIQDFREVVMDAQGKRILKSYKADDPYSMRTHASDAIGYLIAREWPVVKEAMSIMNKPRRPLNREHIMGNVFGQIHTDSGREPARGRSGRK